MYEEGQSEGSHAVGAAGNVIGDGGVGIVFCFGGVVGRWVVSERFFLF